MCVCVFLGFNSSHDLIHVQYIIIVKFIFSYLFK